MLSVKVFVTLAYLCHAHGYVNPRYQNWLQKPNDRVRASFPARRAPSGPRAGPGGGQRRQARFDPPEHPNFDHTHFCPMPEMQQRGATLEEMHDHPWIARVMAGSNNGSASLLVCTAVLIYHKIFITAARCIATAKAQYTVILYKNAKIGVKALIMSSVPTKQLFDDVGLIVTWKPWKDTVVTYEPLRIASIPRTGASYAWFQDRALAGAINLIGFIATEDSPTTVNLYKLENLHASNDVCNKILSMGDESSDYWVPCVHSCSAEEHAARRDSCRRYLLGPGHAVLAGDELLGLATWTCANDDRALAARDGLPLPVGIAVPNKNTFANEMYCAMALEADERHYNIVQAGYYDKVCKKLFFR